MSLVQQNQQLRNVGVTGANPESSVTDDSMLNAESAPDREAPWRVAAYFLCGLPLSLWLLRHGTAFVPAIAWGTTVGPIAAALVSPVYTWLDARRLRLTPHGIALPGADARATSNHNASHDDET